MVVDLDDWIDEMKVGPVYIKLERDVVPDRIIVSSIMEQSAENEVRDEWYHYYRVFIVDVKKGNLDKYHVLRWTYNGQNYKSLIRKVTEEEVNEDESVRAKVESKAMRKPKIPRPCYYLKDSIQPWVLTDYYFICLKTIFADEEFSYDIERDGELYGKSTKKLYTLTNNNVTRFIRRPDGGEESADDSETGSALF